MENSVDETTNLDPSSILINMNIQLMTKIYSLRRTIIFLCFLEIFFNLLNLAINWYYYIPSVLVLIGLYGTYRYNKCLIIFYVIYNFISLSKNLFLVYNYYDKEGYDWVPIFYVFSFIFNLWIILITSRLIRNIRLLDDDELEEMIKGWTPPRTVILLV